MPEVVTCPDCGKKLKVPDSMSGKRMKCPGCGTNFGGESDDEDEKPARRGLTTTRKAPARRDDDEDDRPRTRRRDDDDDDDRPKSRRRDDDDDDDRPKSRRRDEDDDDDDRPRSRRRDDDDDDDDDYPRRRADTGSWPTVSQGINLWVIGAWSILGLAVAYILGIVLIAVVGLVSRDVTITSVLAVLVMGIVGLGFLVAVILMIVGVGMCMRAPSDETHPTRMLAIGAFTCTIVPIVLTMFSYMLLFLLGPNGVILSMILSLLNFGLGIASQVFWILFLRSAASQRGYQDLADRCWRWFITWLVFIGVVTVAYILVIIMTIGIGALAAGGPNAGAQGIMPALGAGMLFFGIFMLCAGIFGLVLYIWEIFLASEVRDVVVSGRKRGRRRR